jgi:hypothetical protein
MSASFLQLAQIAGSQTFQQRVAYAMSVAATNVYSEVPVTNAPTAAGSAVLHFAAVPASVVAGNPASDLNAGGVIPAGTVVLSTTANTVTLSANVTGAGVASGDSVSFVANHSGRAAFAIKVGQGNYNLSAAAQQVLTNATIGTEAANDGSQTNLIPDADIQFAVNSLWNLLAGI